MGVIVSLLAFTAGVLIIVHTSYVSPYTGRFIAILVAISIIGGFIMFQIDKLSKQLDEIKEKITSDHSIDDQNKQNN